MEEAAGKPQVIRFGPYEVDLIGQVLRKGGVKIKLQPKPFQVLAILLERGGASVSRDELKKLLWAPDTFVDFDHGLNTAVNKIREALADSAENPRFIETQPNGYRFIGTVQDTVPPPQEVRKRISTNVPQPLPARQRWPLHYIVIALVCAIFLTVSLLVVRYEHAFSNQPSLEVKSIAVLPLRNFTGDSSQDYFSDNMTEELITQLARTTNLRVVPSASVMRYKNTTISLPEIGRDLKADVFVEGGVLRSEDKVRITAQLIDGRTGRHIWAQDYDGQMQDILVLQHNIASAIATRVQAGIVPSQGTKFPPPQQVDPRAYDAYIKGRGYWFRSKNAYSSPDDLEKSGEEFRRAIQFDPKYAAAYGGLANYYGLKAGAGGFPAKDGWALAEEASRKALELDGTLAEAHRALATKLMFYDWNWDAAEGEIKRGLEFDPRDAELHNVYSHLLAYTGRFDESIAEAHRAEDLDPLGERGSVPRALRFARRYDLFLPAIDSAFPQYPAKIHEARALVFMATKQHAQEVEETDQQLRLEGCALCADRLARAYKNGGYRGWLESKLSGLRKRPEHAQASPLEFAQLFALLGNPDLAMKHLEIAYDQRTAYLVQIGIDPGYDEIRSDPRFQELMNRIGLQQKAKSN